MEENRHGKEIRRRAFARGRGATVQRHELKKPFHICASLHKRLFELEFLEEFPESGLSLGLSYPKPEKHRILI